MKKRLLRNVFLAYLTSVSFNSSAHSLSSILAGWSVLEHEVINEQYERCISYQSKSHYEAVNLWILVPGSFWWRKPERLNIDPKKFYEPDKNKQEAGILIANDLENIFLKRKKDSQNL